MMKLFNLRKKHNNKGMSLVTVIIAIAFVSILVSIILATSLVNFKMKAINEKDKDTFYSAEQVLDEINIGLQRVISDSLSDAYTDVLNNYASYDDAKKDTLLKTKYYENLWGYLSASGDATVHNTYEIAYLEAFLKDTTKWRDSSSEDDTHKSSDGQGFGAILTTKDASGVENATTGVMVTYDNGVVLRDLKVYYKDTSGFVSIISTDIRLSYPNFSFASDSALADIPNYIFIADRGLDVSGSGKIVLDGNIYANNIVDRRTSRGELVIGAADSIPRTIISKYNFDLKDVKFTAVEGTEIWTTNILADTSDVDIDGTVNVRNDLNLLGNETTVKLAGEYNGYSTDEFSVGEIEGADISIKKWKANVSSAILINGVNSTLDMSGLKKITVGGRAYVGVSDNTKAAYKDIANKGVLEGNTLTDDEKAYKNNDVMTGESIAVKPNQLVYLIPGEAIGVDSKTGRSRFNANPLTASQYREITENANYEEVSLKVQVSDLGDTLTDYIVTKSVTGVDENGNTTTTEVGVPQKLFIAKADGSGERLVYYYMNFKDEEAANKYFERNYANNKQSIDNYTKFYVKEIKFPATANLLKLKMAGNYLVEDTVNKQKNGRNGFSSEVPNVLDSESEIDTTTYFKWFYNYCMNLNQEKANTATPKYDDKFKEGTEDADNQVVFENLIGANLEDYIGRAAVAKNNGTIDANTNVTCATTPNLVSGKYTVGDPNAKVEITNAGNSAVVVKGNYMVNDNNVHLVIAGGDVIVNVNDYTGLIICNGKVTAYNGGSIKADPDIVSQALQYYFSDGTNNYPLNTLFNGSENYVYATATDDDADSSRYNTLSRLVTYENWKRE